MNSSLHTHNFHVFDISEYKLSEMAADRALRHMFDIRIVNGEFRLYQVCNLREAGAENYGLFRGKISDFFGQLQSDFIFHQRLRA